MVGPIVAGRLKSALVAAHPLLAAAAQIEDVKAGSGLNIEALEITPDRQRLLIGFRSPLQAGLAIIASVGNPSAIFAKQARRRRVRLPVKKAAIFFLQLSQR